MTNARSRIALLALATAVAVAPAAAADMEAAKKKVAEVCQACHEIGRAHV